MLAQTVVLKSPTYLVKDDLGVIVWLPTLLFSNDVLSSQHVIQSTSLWIARSSPLNTLCNLTIPKPITTCCSSPHRR